MAMTENAEFVQSVEVVDYVCITTPCPCVLQVTTWSEDYAPSLPRTFYAYGYNLSVDTTIDVRDHSSIV